MRKSLVCPKCEGRKIWRVEHVRTPAMTSSGRPSEVGVLVAGSVWRGYKAIGGYETFSCARCGYTEWYAHGLEELRHDPAQGIHLIDNEPEGGLR
jgi:predicted nucleic-acid-binding Zn-ribbon protein